MGVFDKRIPHAFFIRWIFVFFFIRRGGSGGADPPQCDTEITFYGILYMFLPSTILPYKVYDIRYTVYSISIPV